MVAQCGQGTVKSFKVDACDLRGAGECSGQDFETAPMEWEDRSGRFFCPFLVTRIGLANLFDFSRIVKVNTNHMKVFRADGWYRSEDKIRFTLMQPPRVRVTNYPFQVSQLIHPITMLCKLL
jgi:hypothetical protein